MSTTNKPGDQTIKSHESISVIPTASSSAGHVNSNVQSYRPVALEMESVAPSQVAVDITPPPAQSAATESQNTFQRVSKVLGWAGLIVFNVVERIGETVVEVLGLDDSHYQDILDNMTEDELRRAQEVHIEREAERDQVRCIKELRQQSQGELVVMEEGA